MPTEREAQLTEALEHHRAGRMDAAHEIYRGILGDDPDCPEALNFMGVLYSQHGKPDIAVQLLQRAIHTSPRYADAHNNMGNVLVELHDVANAMVAYGNALACDPELAAAHNNLGVLLRREGQSHESIQHMLQAVVLRPDWATAHLGLGNAYAQMGYADRAIEQFRRAIELEPTLSAAQHMLGHYLAARGDRQGAARTFERLIEIDPDNVVAHHMLAATSGRNVPVQASRAYIEQSFDEFASSFEQKLAKLDYRAPELLAERLAIRLPGPTGPLRVLDLGCGTGLCAPHLRPFASELLGVDLSPKMLARARQRETYDELVIADLVDYLREGGAPFDVMVSADVLIYFGSLREILQGISRRLVDGGWLFFSVEKWDGNIAGEADTNVGYRLEPHGRYSHTGPYVEQELRRADLELVSIEEEEVRKEMKEPVLGWIVTARKRPTS